MQKYMIALSQDELKQILDRLNYESLPIASSTVLGGVKIGQGINVARDGTISVTSLSGNAATATKLATACKINGTNFNGTEDITTASWGSSRSVNISDADASNTGSAVAVDGSSDTTLKLPSTIKATLKGNADTATQFSTNKSVTLTGDVTGTAASKAGWSITTTLADSGVASGGYGPPQNTELVYAGTFFVPYITVDSKGRVIAASTKTIKIPASDNTDTHWTTTCYAGAKDTKANSVAANGAAYIKLFDNSTLRSQLNIKGTGATTVVTDTAGVITINSTDTNTTYSNFVKSGSGAKAGLVPAPSTTAGTTKYLREDGTWTVPPDTKYTAASAAPKAAGTAAVGTSAKYAREDHVHPVQTSVSGNAGTATQFKDSQTVELTGDVTGTKSSKAGWSIATTLANSGVASGNYGPSSNASPAHSGTFSVPYFSVDTKGRITSAATRTITLPAVPTITDDKVKQTKSTGNNQYPILLCPTANANANQGAKESIFAPNVTVNPSDGSITASKFYGAIVGGYIGSATHVQYNSPFSTTGSMTSYSTNSQKEIFNHEFSDTVSGSTTSNGSGAANRLYSGLVGPKGLPYIYYELLNSSKLSNYTGSALRLVLQPDPNAYIAEMEYSYYPDGNVSAVSGVECNLGSTVKYWKDVYTSGSCISMSDARYKTNVSSIPEELLDAWKDVEWKQFKMKDAVQKKGDQARTHTGLLAQQVKQVLSDRNLNASDYAFFCHNTWKAQEEIKDASGRVIQAALPAGDKYSLRYEEALCIEVAYLRRELAREKALRQNLEDRLVRLENLITTSENHQ